MSEELSADKAFWDWWINGGSEQWANALDAEKGTLGALEIVFTAGLRSASMEHQTAIPVSELRKLETAWRTSDYGEYHDAADQLDELIKSVEKE